MGPVNGVGKTTLLNSHHGLATNQKRRDHHERRSVLNKQSAEKNALIQELVMLPQRARYFSYLRWKKTCALVLPVRGKRIDRQSRKRFQEKHLWKLFPRIKKTCCIVVVWRLVRWTAKTAGDWSRLWFLEPSVVDLDRTNERYSAQHR